MKRLHRRTFLKHTAKGVVAGAGAAAAASAAGAAGAASIAPGTARATQVPTVFFNPEPKAATNSANPIVAENELPGTQAWKITQFDIGLEGFASATSVVPGETLDFFINTSAPKFDLRIYRTGYYGGQGGRLVAEALGLTGQVQPEGRRDNLVGLGSCSNWVVSHQLVVPKDWVSGVYTAKLMRPDTGGENQIVFVLRENEVDAAEGAQHSAILMQQSVTTYQAYNNAFNSRGGKSLYHFNSNACLTVADGPRAVKVSLDRPLNQTPTAPNTYFFTDFPMAYWLEAQGYDVSYCTNMDTHEWGKAGARNRLADHRVFLSVGHDEYWSSEMRTAITAARDAGTHLGFFSSNTGYWRIRLEPDPWSAKPNRVVVCYKTTEGGAADASGHATGTWRDSQGANDPENSLIGPMYVGDNDQDFFPIRVSAVQGKDRIYRHTPLQHIPDGEFMDVGRNLVGWEWDAVVDNGRTPLGLVVLAETPTYGGLLADEGRRYRIGKAAAQATRYVAPSGAIVFASGTIQWAMGLAIYEPNLHIQQITCNLLDDMSVQPATPAETLKVSATSGRLTHYDDGVSLGLQPPVWQGAYNALTPIKLADSAEPVLHVMQIAPGRAGAVFTCEANVPVTIQIWVKLDAGLIDYRLSARNGWLMPVAAHVFGDALAMRHMLEANYLRPGTRYFYEMAVRDELGRVTLVPEGSFITEPGSATDSARHWVTRLINGVPCWIKYNASVVGAGVVLGLGAVAAFIRWRVMRFARLSAIRSQEGAAQAHGQREPNKNTDKT